MRVAVWMVLGSAFASACGGGHEAAPPRPNIVLVYTDDQRWDSLGVTGNPYIETPHLDRIATEGALFERAYVTTSRCCPGRASLLSGKYAHSTGVWSNRPEHDFLDDHRTFADHLSDAGYETAYVGKWHLSNPGAMPVRGFDHWVSYEGPGSHVDQALNVDGETVESSGFQADVLTDYALDFLSRDRGDRPFLLVLALKNPHVPLTPPERHRGHLADVAVELPPTFRQDPETMPQPYRRARRDEDNRHGAGAAGEFQDAIRSYWELVLSIDDNVGRLLDRLEDLELSDETLVVFTTDNGQMMGEHGLTQKGLSYEPSIRVPLAMRYPPAIAPGTRTAGIALNVDVAPTLLAAAGIPVPADVQGRDLLRLLDGAAWRESFVYSAPDRGGLVENTLVGPRYKLIRFQAEGQTVEVLFDLEADPDEIVDLALDGSYSETVERLGAELDLELAALGQ